jgi:DnaA family protein
MMSQLALGIFLRDDATFNNFYAESNSQLCVGLKASSSGEGERFHYLWGSTGVGRTHLLQACCHHASQFDLRSVYLPMNDILQLSPHCLDDLESLALVCIDDIHLIARNSVWEEAFFHFYNRMQFTSTRLVVAAGCAPADLGLSLRDLSSRLSACLVFHMHGLSDEGKLRALQMHAKTRGLDLPNDVGQFVLRRCLRDMSTLCAVLDKLDEASLAAQRKLTVPFVKSVLKL